MEVATFKIEDISKHAQILTLYKVSLATCIFISCVCLLIGYFFHVLYIFFSRYMLLPQQNDEFLGKFIIIFFSTFQYYFLPLVFIN